MVRGFVYNTSSAMSCAHNQSPAWQVTDCVWCQTVNEERAQCLVARYLVYRVVPRRRLIVRPPILDLHDSQTHHHTQAQSLSGSKCKLSSSRAHGVSNVAEGDEEEGTDWYSTEIDGGCPLIDNQYTLNINSHVLAINAHGLIIDACTSGRTSLTESVHA